MSVEAFSAIPVFFVKDLPRSLAFYRDALGWSVSFVWPEEGAPEHAGVCLGQATIHLSPCADDAVRPKSHAYMVVRGVDAYAGDLRAWGVSFEGPGRWE